MSDQRNTQVAETILQQLGGMGKLHAMIGAKNFSATETSITFRFMMNPKINCIKIELNWKDTYDITYYKLGRVNFKEVKKEEDVYATDLKRTIKETSGLDLSL